MLTIALPKGRIFDEVVPLLAKVGLAIDTNNISRKLILPTQNPDVRLIIVRSTDVPTYVRYGAADIGIAGKDVLDECGNAGLYRALNLNIARCKMVIAVQETTNYEEILRQKNRLRIASKYSKTASQYFAQKGIHVDLIKLYGSMELAPLVGLADVIVDLMESGETLRANQLRPVETISEISAYLIVSEVSNKLKYQLLSPLIQKITAITTQIKPL